MKAWSILYAAAALAVSCVNAQAAPTCDLIKIFSLVKPLESNADVKKCIEATGYELLPPPGAPTKEQVAKLCDNASCKNVFAALQKLNIPDCTISILGGLNMKKVIDGAFGQCSGSGGSTTPAPSKAATPTVTPTKAPATPASKPASSTAPTTPPPVGKPATPSAATPAPTEASSGDAKLPDSTTPAPGATPAATSGKATKPKLCHD
nr:elicitin-like protein [Pythium porphyrae]